MRQCARIRIGQPVRDVPTAGGTDWRCPVSISGIPITRPLRGFGVGSLPALIGALKVVDLEIKAFERGLPGKFEWFGMACHGAPSVRMASVPEAEQPNKDAAPDRGREAVRARRVAARRGRGG